MKSSLLEYAINNGRQDLVDEWDAEKNGDFMIDQISCGTPRKVWWRCELGHEWEGWIMHVCRGAGCPICDGKQVLVGFNDLKSQDPELAAEWHPTFNGDVTPEMVTRSSNKRAWWICELGHAWEAYINSRTGSSRPGCPYCTGKKVLPGFNDLKTLEPKIADQWHPELNGDLTPDQVTCGSNMKAWWVCGEGHVWNAVINSRAGIQKCGCPVCTGNMNKKKLEKYKRMEEEARFKLLGEKRLAELKAKQEKEKELEES